MISDNDLIKALKKGDRKAQKVLYDRFSAKMFGVCRRYIKHDKDTEDVFLEAFFKVYKNIKDFKHTGSFEGWIRKIMVNECLMFLRKNKLKISDVEIQQLTIADVAVNGLERLKEQDIKILIADLPDGYRTIFNLYVIEGFKHREIAEKLNISINTSKSQLILAKKKLAQLIEKLNNR